MAAITTITIITIIIYYSDEDKAEQKLGRGEFQTLTPLNPNLQGEGELTGGELLWFPLGTRYGAPEAVLDNIPG